MARAEPRAEAQPRKVTDALEDQDIPVRVRPCRLVCRASARRGECFAVHVRTALLLARRKLALSGRDGRAAEDEFRAASDFAASKTFFGGFDAGWGAHDLENRLNHPTPATQFGIVLQGTFSITTTDGETRRLRPGSVFRLEDTSPCKGHITVVGDQTGFLMFVR